MSDLNEQQRQGMAVAATLLFLPIKIAAAGWVLSVLWGWFAVPAGMPALGFWNAVGLRLVVVVLWPERPRGPKVEPDAAADVLHSLVVLSSLVLVLAVAAVAHSLSGAP